MKDLHQLLQQNVMFDEKPSQHVFMEDPDVTAAKVNEIYGAMTYIIDTIAQMNPAYAAMIQGPMGTLASRLQELDRFGEERAILRGDGVHRRLRRWIYNEASYNSSNGDRVIRSAEYDADMYKLSERLAYGAHCVDNTRDDVQMNLSVKELGRIWHTNFTMEINNYERRMHQTSLGAPIVGDHPYWEQRRSGDRSEYFWLTGNHDTDFRSKKPTVRDVQLNMNFGGFLQMVYHPRSNEVKLIVVDRTENVQREFEYHEMLPRKLVLDALRALWKTFTVDENAVFIDICPEPTEDLAKARILVLNSLVNRPQLREMVTEKYLETIPYPENLSEKLPLGGPKGSDDTYLKMGYVYILRKRDIKSYWDHDKTPKNALMIHVIFADWVADIMVPSVESQEAPGSSIARIVPANAYLNGLRFVGHRLYENNSDYTTMYKLQELPHHEWELLQKKVDQAVTSLITVPEGQPAE